MSEVSNGRIVTPNGPRVVVIGGCPTLLHIAATIAGGMAAAVGAKVEADSEFIADRSVQIAEALVLRFQARGQEGKDQME